MNYGEFFLENYNNQFIRHKKKFLNYIEESYNSPQTFDALFNDYDNKLYHEIKKIEDILDWRLVSDCYHDFNCRYHSYRKNPTIEVVNKEIFDRFERNSKNLEIKFEIFCDYGATYFLINDFKKFLKNKKQSIKNAFEIEFTNGLLKLNKNKHGEYVLNPEILPIVNKNKFKQIELDSDLYTNPFNDDEKFIITHFFIDLISKNRDVISKYEEIVIIKLIADIYVNKSFTKKKDTFYEKYTKGINYSTKSSRFKKKQLEDIISKSKEFDIPKFIQYLESKLYKM